MMSYFEQLTEWVIKIHGSRLWRGLGLAGLIFLSCGLVGCEIPRVNAEERLFSHVNLEFIGDYILPGRRWMEPLWVVYPGLFTTVVRNDSMPFLTIAVTNHLLGFIPFKCS